MVPHNKCQDVMVTWTIGMQGDCLHQDTGFRLGKHGYTMVALQVGVACVVRDSCPSSSLHAGVRVCQQASGVLTVSLIHR